MVPFKQILLSFFIISLILGACAPDDKKSPASATGPVIINKKEVLPAEKRQNHYTDVDISPMDMSYYPPNYPQLKMSNGDIELPVMRVIYSRPHLQGRQMFDDILRYNEPWRLGANEATELQVFQPVSILGNRLKPGRYTLHSIPNEKEWTFAVNSAVDIWGLKYDASKDLFQVKVPVTHDDIPMEYFTMVFEKSTDGANLVMAWGNVVARLPFTF